LSSVWSFFLVKLVWLENDVSMLMSIASLSITLHSSHCFVWMRWNF
jgi:hypothetical protein